MESPWGHRNSYVSTISSMYFTITVLQCLSLSMMMMHRTMAQSASRNDSHNPTWPTLRNTAIDPPSTKSEGDTGPFGWPWWWWIPVAGGGIILLMVVSVLCACCCCCRKRFGIVAAPEKTQHKQVKHGTKVNDSDMKRQTTARANCNIMSTASAISWGSEFENDGIDRDRHESRRGQHELRELRLNNAMLLSPNQHTSENLYMNTQDLRV